MSSALTPWPYPLWWAHRGAGKLAPENTLAAFRHGASHGFRAFECDVKLSADDVPFLLHDDTLDRTTSAQGLAGTRSWTELSRLDAGGWRGRQWAGEPLASLQAIAAYLQRNGHAVDLEIKPTPGTELRTGQKVAEAALQLWAGQPRQPLLSSFKTEALQGAKQAAPALPRALLLDSLWPDWWDAARDLACCAVITHYSLMDAALIRKLHAAGLRGLVYTANEGAEVARLLSLPDGGIDGIITDAVDKFAAGTALDGLLE
jgi:glycerophosphoryl diester phosphodiesterase